jgi:hypothetical protein
LLLVALASCRSAPDSSAQERLEASLLQERLDSMPFVLSGVLMNPDGWPAQGEHFYRITQFPQELLSKSDLVHSGTLNCDPQGFFMIRLGDFEVDNQRPLAIRIGTSEEVVGGVANWELVDDLTGMQLYATEGHFRKSEVADKQVHGIELGQVQLDDLPLVKEVWLGSDEIDELIFRVTPYYPSWGTYLEDWMGREFTLRTDRPLRLYTERSDRSLRFLPHANSGWFGRASCEMGGSIVVDVHPRQLVRAINYQERPIELREGWSWTRLVDQRCGPRSHLRLDHRTLRNRALGPYKLLIWSRERTADGLPLLVADIEVVAGEQDVRIR